MRRFILASLGAVAILGLAYFIEGGRLSALFFASPFLITFGMPFFAVLAVWSLGTWGRAWADAMKPQADSRRREISAELWDFYEKACYAAGILAFIVGCVIILRNHGDVDGRLAESFAVNLISPLYAIFLALLARILRFRVRTGGR